MASISIVFDTLTKEMKATIDGKPVDNVVGVELFPSWDDPDEFRCSVMTKSEDEASGIKSYTQMVASESPRGRELAAAGRADPSADFAGFVAGPADRAPKASRDISAFFGD